MKIATILGPNASGKSNIIKAFAMLHDLFLAPCTNKSSRIAYSKFALDAAMQKQDSQMIVNFICGEEKYHYEVTFNDRYVVSELLIPWMKQILDWLSSYMLPHRENDRAKSF